MQRGQIFQRNNAWYCRHYEGRKRVTKWLGYTAEYPTKRSIEALAQDILRQVNRSTEAGVTLDSFVEQTYLPFARELRPSTWRGYAGIWRTYITGRPEAQLRVREYRTVDVQRLLDAVAAENELSSTTLGHFKAYLSGVFRHAAQVGIREGNPVREARIPRTCRPVGETYAYSLEEIRSVLTMLDIMPRAAVAVAAFAGLRLAEMHGLMWSDYTGVNLNIARSMWRGHTNPTKSKASQNYIPVIQQLKAILDEYRMTSSDSEQVMFPADLENVGRTLVKSAMKKVGITWRGWHAFRRGIASNLFALGCDDLTVSRVLRHSKVQITREKYIKVRDPKLEDAMHSTAFGPRIGQA
jgi:integrase